MSEAQSSGGLSVGEVVAGRYVIQAVLGEGGMGVVYRAEHTHLRKPFALKVLLPEWTSSPEIVARFEREAVAAGNIQSPHVAAATDFGKLPDGSFFLVMEYVEGRTLRSALEPGALEPARALSVARGIAAGLQAAHAAGIVHRDMKPENVMLVARDGDPDFVKLLDFGIAKVEPTTLGGHSPEGASPLTRVGSIIGTPDYMSPEQALGQPVDARTDQYALGIMLFEMLTGNRPFEGDAVSVLRQHVMSPPPELPVSLAASTGPRVGAVLRRLLATAPENRFASAAEIVSAIEECARDAQPQVIVAPPADSKAAVAIPASTRLRHSLMAGVDALRGEARLVLANPASLLRERRRVLVAGVVAGVVILGILTAMVGGSGARAEKASPSASSTASAPEMRGIAASPSTETEQPESMADLPPPPVPSSSARSAPGRPSPSQGQSHRTGPGGIYIPPPSQWFK